MCSAAATVQSQLHAQSAQAGAVALLADPRYAGKLPLFGGVEKVRWRRLVQPGDEITMEVTLDKLSARGGWGNVIATVDGQKSMQAQIFFAIGDATA